MCIRKRTFFLVLFFLSHIHYAQQPNPLLVKHCIEEQGKWVDSLYTGMSIEERVGQLFMIDIFSSAPNEKITKVKQLIENYHIGGVIFSKGGPQRQAKLNNEFHSRISPIAFHYSSIFIFR